MSFFGDFVGGAATATAGIIGDRIKSEQELATRRQMAEHESALALAKEKAMIALKEQMAIDAENRGIKNKDDARTKMVSSIDQGAQGIVSERMAGNQVSDESTWTPEMEAARNQGMSRMASNPRTRADAAAKAGYIDEASKLDKLAESGASTVAWGSTRVDSDGNVIYDNGSELKGRINQDKADGKGVPRKADHFDEKQWDAAAKIDKSVISFTDQMTGKETPSIDLRTAYLKSFNIAKSSGELSPNEAVEFATSNIEKLRNKALDVVTAAQKADPKSTLTQEQAIKQILSAFEKSGAAKNQAGTGSYSSEAGLKATAQGDMGADPTAAQNEINEATEALKTVTDPQSRKDLQGYIENMKRQLAAIGGPATAQKPAPATTGIVNDKKQPDKPKDPMDGKSFKERQEAVAQRFRLIDTDPALNAIKEEANRLVKSGKVVAANAKLDEFNRLKQQKYGS